MKDGDLPYMQEGEGTSHLYRMTLRKDNTVRVDIDEKKVHDSGMKEDWELREHPPLGWVENLFRYPLFPSCVANVCKCNLNVFQEP